MKKFSLFLSLGLLFTSFHAAQAGIIYESGTLGETGIPFADVSGGAVPSTNVSRFVFAGARFELTQPTLISQVGGHFVKRAESSDNTFFGAIVKLENENDFPNSGDFSTPDFIDSTLLNFPDLSGEVFGELSLSLEPSWYALVFGSGLLEANGIGVALRNGIDIENPSYIGFQPSTPVGWSDLTLDLPNHRFVVKGQIVPEVSSITLTSIAAIFLSFYKRAYINIKI